MPIIAAMLCRRARLVPNQAARGFAPDNALGILAVLNVLGEPIPSTNL
jgi:hypothetical protein